MKMKLPTGRYDEDTRNGPKKHKSPEIEKGLGYNSGVGMHDGFNAKKPNASRHMAPGGEKSKSKQDTAALKVDPSKLKKQNQDTAALKVDPSKLRRSGSSDKVMKDIHEDTTLNLPASKCVNPPKRGAQVQQMNQNEAQTQ